MVGWHHLLKGHEFEQAVGVGDGQGSMKWDKLFANMSFHFHALEKEMAPHSSVLAWRIPGTVEPGGLPSMGSQSRTRLKRLSSSSSRPLSAGLPGATGRVSARCYFYCIC